MSRAKSFRDEMLRRRTVRQFSSRTVPRVVIEDCLSVARSAPSGANKQPWHFVVVSDAEVKTKIHAAMEEEERRFYHERAPKECARGSRAARDSTKASRIWKPPPFLIVIFALCLGKIKSARLSSAS